MADVVIYENSHDIISIIIGFVKQSHYVCVCVCVCLSVCLSVYVVVVVFVLW